MYKELPLTEEPADEELCEVMELECGGRGKGGWQEGMVGVSEDIAVFGDWDGEGK